MKFLICFFLFPFFSHSNSLSPALFLSQGGSGGASLREDFSFLINPATMAFQKKNKSVLAYSFKKKEHTALFSFLDLKTNFPLAISYQRNWSRSFTSSDADKMFVSSALKISSFLSFGINIEQERLTKEWNGDFGSLFRVGNQTSLALFLNQILKKEMKNSSSLSIAVYHNWKNFFSIKMDASRYANKQWIVKGGIESLFQRFFSLRVGGTWFQKNKDYLLSGGLAFQSPKLLLEYSIETDYKMYQQAFILIIHI